MSVTISGQSFSVLRLIIGLVVLVIALVLAVMGRMPGMEALLFGLLAVGVML